MEDVVRSLRPGDDRGQLILVTGLAIAVILVALVLLLNTVIYTENLATRGADVGGRDVIVFRNDAIHGVRGILVTENEANHSTAAAARENVTQGVGRFADLLERGYFERATIADISNVSTTDGVMLRQENGTRAFTNGSGSTDWTLVKNVNEDGLRRFRLDINRSTLATTPSDAFSVVTNDSDGDTWRVTVYREGDNITVANTSMVVCRANTSDTTLDLTSGRLDGQPCSFRFANSSNTPYRVEFRNGNRATGTYSLVVNETDGVTRVGTNFNLSATDTAPYMTPAVYSATFDIYYRTPRLTYADHVRVAPGEHDD